VSVNAGLAHVSTDFMIAALLIYSLALLAFAGDYAFGRPRRRAAMLSGGQRSMLAMGRALMLEPAVMLLDEPSAGLSPLLQGTLWEQIEKVAATGVGICVVEQNTRLTLRHAHWGYILVLGRNRLDGPAHELLHDDSVVELYVGRMS